MDIPELHWSYTLYSTLVLLADFFIRIGLSIRVIMRKRPYGVSLAWLVVILVIPFLGGFFYLLFGENRLPERRKERAETSYSTYLSWLKTLQKRTPVAWEELCLECFPLSRQAETLVGIPTMAGNHLTLITQHEDILSTIIKAIDNAASTCHLQFYIWQEGGSVNKVIKALFDAVDRGVQCRILLDSIGSRDFLKSGTAAAMRQAGIRIQESLPAGIINALFSRTDIRNHRKLVIIDGRIAFTGSQNMVDPKMFKRDAGVGNWVDVMVQVEGPVVECMAGTFISDWILDSDRNRFNSESLLRDIQAAGQAADVRAIPEVGETAIQLVPSGPGLVPDAIHSLLLTTIYAARFELILTTPYFIPDEPLLIALKAAAQRGVLVKIIVPLHNDSLLVKYASRARYQELAESGVRILLFHGGLLHSKTITVDHEFALFGSVNLDMRSFWLNFEATLFIYCKSFTEKLLVIQREYLLHSTELDIDAFSQRGSWEKFKENSVLLVSPLL